MEALVPGSVQCGHLEPQRHLAASRAATSSASRIRSPSSFNQPKYAGVVAGRLAASTEQLTLNLGLRYDLLKDAFNNARRVPALDGRRASAGRGQHPAAPGRRVSVERPHRPARRRGALLHRRHRELLDALDAREHHRVPRGRQRRASGLRDESVQRSGAELSAGAAAGLRRQQDAFNAWRASQLRWQRAMPVPRLRGTGAARGSRRTSRTAGRARSACSGSWPPTCRWKSTTSTTAAATRRCCRTRSNLGYNAATGVNYPVRGEWAEPRVAAVSRVRARSATTAYTGRSDYHGAADRVDQAVQQPVAGLGELLAVARSRTTSRRSR